MRLLVSGLAVLLLSACSGGDPGTAPTSTAPASTTPSATHAAEPLRPGKGECYRLTYAQAIAPTTDVPPVSCKRTYTARTFHVGTFDAVLDGHLLAVDSARVQDKIADDCTRRMGDYVGGDADDLALSMFRVVWFSPTVEASDAGADWYRCDLTALASENRLVALRGPIRGVLDGASGLEAWGSCGTTEPGKAGFARVVCSAKHTWRAVGVVRHGGRKFPGPRALTADRDSCEDPAREVASDPLKVVFSYLAPTREQWNAGQHYGTCWVPTT